MYREFPERAHEGFQELYPEVLRWLGSRPRRTFPKTILRVPHRGIVPLAKRVHWIEADTRQASFRATVEGQHIEIVARWARKLEVFLHDELVDLDQTVRIRVNGVRVFDGELERSIPFALEQVRELFDVGRPYSASVTVAVPETEVALEAGRNLTESLEPQQPEGALSFWEMYATRALEERFPTLGLTGERVTDPSTLGLAGERTAIRILDVRADGPFAESGLRAGDVLLEVDGEPFFEGRGPEEVHDWLVRELDRVPRNYPLSVLRDGERLELTARLALGGYETSP